jgi:hypothetical protein
MGGKCSTHGGDDTYKIVVVKSDGERLFKRPSRKLGDNIKIYIREIGYLRSSGSG